MKATISGIMVEGSPEEIFKFKELMAKSEVVVNVYVNEAKGLDIKKITEEINKSIKKSPVIFGKSDTFYSNI